MKGNNWGGKRAGAGRKKSLFERKGRTFRLTDAEFLEVKPLVDAVRRRTEEAMLATLATKNKKQLYVLNTTEFNQLSAFDYKLVWKIDSLWGRFFLILQNLLDNIENYRYNII